MRMNRSIINKVGGAVLLSFAWVIVSCQGVGVTDREFYLSDGWRVQSSRQISVGGELLSEPDYDARKWYEASVPSTVMGVLTSNGLYNGLLEGDCYRNFDKTLFDTTWWYRTEFRLPVLKANEHVFLQFEGISYAANIWLNGYKIASREEVKGSFRQFRLDITEVANESNVLAVELFRAQAGDPNIGFADWNPRPADENMGIFRGVRVLLSHEVSIKNSYVHSKVNLKTLDEAWLIVETELANASEYEINGTLNGELEGKTFSVPVKLAPGESHVVRLDAENVPMLHLENPRLWWSHDLGNPDMYRMHLSFNIDGKVSDVDDVDFGVREIGTYFTEEGHRGFTLNGKQVLLKSAGWTDDIFLRNTPQRYETEVRYVRDMNLNSIRFENIWGTSQEVYDLCDKNGLLVLLGWSCQWEWENYLGTPCDEFGGIRDAETMDLVAASLKDQILWLRNHPCITAWLVGSDDLPRPELEKRYLSFFSQMTDCPYVGAAKALTSQLTGPTGTKMAGPYDYVPPIYWYSAEAVGGAVGFNTETGIGAQLPVKESICRMIPGDKLWPLNDVWDFHCTHSAEAMHSLDVLQESIAQRYGAAQNLDDFLRKADLLNYEGTRAMFEAFRINLPKSTGIVQWMLNSAWPSLYWQLYDYYLIPTAAYYGVKKGNAAQQLIYDYKRKAVFAVNERMEPFECEANLTRYDIQGNLLDKQTRMVSVQPRVAQKVFEVPDIDGVSFLFLNLDSKKGGSASNFYWLASQPDELDWDNTSWIRTPLKKSADFTSLTSMPQAVCIMTSTLLPDANILQVTVENTSDEVAFFLRLSLKDETGALICPVFWGDNYFSLAPGETRVVECELLDMSVSAGLSLSMEGWNVPAIHEHVK